MSKGSIMNSIMSKIKERCEGIVAIAAAVSIVIGGVNYLIKQQTEPIVTKLTSIQTTLDKYDGRFAYLESQDNKMAMMFAIHESDPDAHKVHVIRKFLGG